MLRSSSSPGPATPLNHISVGDYQGNQLEIYTPDSPKFTDAITVMVTNNGVGPPHLGSHSGCQVPFAELVACVRAFVQKKLTEPRSAT